MPMSKLEREQWSLEWQHNHPYRGDLVMTETKNPFDDPVIVDKVMIELVDLLAQENKPLNWVDTLLVEWIKERRRATER